MRKKALLALLLVAAMLLTGCSLIEKDLEVDRAREIIRVGDTVYTKGRVQDQVDYNLSYMAFVYQMYGMNFDPTDPAAIADAQEQTISALIEDAVKNIKVKELGLDQLTDEEQAELDQNIEEAWQTNLDSVKSTYFADTELTGEELDAAIAAKCAEIGLQKESVVEGQTITFNQNKLREYVIKDVTVSDEELQAAFDERVESAKTSYASNLSSYGSAVNNESTIYYRPEGYRMVKQILVKFLEADQAVIDDLNSAISTQNTQISSLTTSLRNAGVEDVDALLAEVNVTLKEPEAPADEADENGVKPQVATGTDIEGTMTSFAEDTDEDVAQTARTLAEAKALLVFYQQQLDAAKTIAFENIDAKADAIIARLDAGEDWDAVMAETTEDPGMQGDRATAATGYAVCENFSGFDTAFTTAAMALEKVGDVSPKTEGAYGYYIIQYTSDVTEGPVALDEVRDTLMNATLTTKQDTVYDDTLTQWTTDLNPKVDRNALND